MRAAAKYFGTTAFDSTVSWTRNFDKQLRGRNGNHVSNWRWISWYFIWPMRNQTWGESGLLRSSAANGVLELKLGRGNFQVVQRDVRGLPALIEAIQSHKAQTVVHTAGLIGSRVAESLYTGFHINVVGTMNVAEAVRLIGVKRMVHISTFGVYDWRKEASEPLTEDFHKGSGVPYGNSKVARELLLEAIRGCTSLN